jgi:hypothetical protein
MIATHARKARRESRCPLCRRAIHIGERICRIGARGDWMHVLCFSERWPVRAADGR